MELREIVEIASAGADGRHVSVDVMRATVRPVDIAALAQVLTELVENAANASSSQGTIEVAAWSNDEGVALSIRDHGHGIPDELLRLINAALSEPSAIPDAAVSGLSNVARLALKHGMQVQLTSSTSGTTAEIQLQRGIVELAREPVSDEPRSDPIPERDVGQTESGESTTVSTLPSEEPLDMTWPTTPALSYTDEEAADVEEFLAQVFSQLASDEAATPVAEPSPSNSSQTATITELRVRVPGTSFSDRSQDEIHSTSADGANEIRFALTSYDIGRDAARREARGDADPD